MTETDSMNISSVAAGHDDAVAVRGEFRTSKIRFVEHMGFLEVASFLGEGVGAALYVLGVYLTLPLMAALGIVFVALAVVALLSHLGTRAHLAWRALARLRTSWVSRGSLFIFGFLATSVLSLFAQQVEALEAARQPLTAVALIFAVLVIIYAGMMLRSMRAVSLWRTAYLPLAFSAHSLASAAMISWVFVLATGSGEASAGWLRYAAIGLLALTAAISFAHLRPARPSAGVQASLNRLFAGELRTTLWAGASLAGIAVPFAALLASELLLRSAGEGIAVVILVFAAASRLFGDYSYRLAIVKAGAYEPIVPPVSRTR